MYKYTRGDNKWVTDLNVRRRIWVQKLVFELILLIWLELAESIDLRVDIHLLHVHVHVVSLCM